MAELPRRTVNAHHSVRGSGQAEASNLSSAAVEVRMKVCLQSKMEAGHWVLPQARGQIRGTTTTLAVLDLKEKQKAVHWFELLGQEPQQKQQWPVTRSR
mmetsp:Transcript_43180/g.94144  ORF Transcript_43180/g.94144 Transcript_43180/m.94144 type:complete len:99 (+) Transcript_43180:19-315(+)